MVLVTLQSIFNYYTTALSLYVHSFYVTEKLDQSLSVTNNKNRLVFVIEGEKILGYNTHRYLYPDNPT